MTYILDVVCTDRGQHKRARLTKIAFNEDDSVSWRAGGSFYPPDDLLEPPLSAEGRPRNDLFALGCHRCGRTPELRPERFRELVLRLRSLGVSRLDISDLPF